MRIAEVIGTVTLNRCHPNLEGGTFKLFVSRSADDLKHETSPSADVAVTYDELGAGIGSLIALSEGGEATQPFQPAMKPIDAYNAAILDDIDI